MQYTEAELRHELTFWEKYFEQIMVNKKFPHETEIPNSEAGELLLRAINGRDYTDIKRRIARLNKLLEEKKSDNVSVEFKRLWIWL